jgi:hypothetical protein
MSSYVKFTSCFSVSNKPEVASIFSKKYLKIFGNRLLNNLQVSHCKEKKAIVMENFETICMPNCTSLDVAFA